MFRVPMSSAPSTPDSSPNRNNGPSTTPAGPPPDLSFFGPSSTPAGPPPPTSNLFNGGGGGGVKSFNLTRPTGTNNARPGDHFSGAGSGLFGAPPAARPGFQQGGRSTGGFGVPSSPPEGDDDYDDEEDDEEMGDEGEQDGEYDEEEDDAQMTDDQEEEEAMGARRNGARAETRRREDNRHSQSLLSQTSDTQEAASASIVRPGAKQSQYDLLNLAKGLTPQLGQGSLRESDDVILETERLLEKLQRSMDSDSPEQRSDVVGEVAQELVAVWQSSSSSSNPYPPLAYASMLASLILSIHHPSHIAERERPFALSLAHSRSDLRHYTPIPRLLLDWLNKNFSSVSEVALVMSKTQGFSAHEHFWDAVRSSAIHGNFADVLKLLRGANFSVAETADEDGMEGSGYKGEHLFNTNRVVQDAINVIEQCPAIESEDWDVKGTDWTIFRQRVQLALKELQDYAEGDSQNRHNISQSFQASHFGISQSQHGLHLSVASRRAESRVPWSIYENLTRLYDLLLGSDQEILAVTGDWVEAVVVLTVWWNGEEEDSSQGSLAASRRSLARSQRIRTVDITPVKAYCQRLSAALATVLEDTEGDFSINTTDRAEVGLACIFDDNVEGVLQILRSWSLPIASAVAEVATSGDWFRRADGIIDQFDQSDLMVLSYNEDQRVGLSKDDLLIAYSKLLAAKENLKSRDGKTSREGWELAVQVLDRLDDHHIRETWIENILADLKLESAERVDKVTQLCSQMGYVFHAQRIALDYAEHLRRNTQNYGDILLYYARAHKEAKIQEVLRVLVAHCLIKSLAYPPLAELDESLKSLITSPKQTLTKLAALDPEGAHLLSTQLSGYATIRKFYDLRDEEIFGTGGEKPAHRPMARKRAAANALMVLISSAASSIRGGLYDPEVETVVQVDVLLPLLGEALLFVNQSKRTLTLQHIYSLLAAVEDLDTAPGMIRTQCEDVLSTALAAAHDGRTPSPRSLLQKSTSNMMASSQFSLIGTDVGSLDAQSTESSAVLIKGGNVDDTKRAWDWRKGFKKDASGSDVVRVLRLGIAREAARAFAEGEV